MGRNQGLYDFWFYVTSFARYPGDFTAGTGGRVLLVRVFVRDPDPAGRDGPIAGRAAEDAVPNPWVIVVAPLTTALCLWGSRRIFNWSLSPTAVPAAAEFAMVGRVSTLGGCFPLVE